MALLLMVALVALAVVVALAMVVALVVAQVKMVVLVATTEAPLLRGRWSSMLQPSDSRLPSMWPPERPTQRNALSDTVDTEAITRAVAPIGWIPSGFIAILPVVVVIPPGTAPPLPPPDTLFLPLATRTTEEEEKERWEQ